ncbi:DEAD/DEAH box helicase [Agromyces indicus]|uniref:DEAD/DEAH box helicase n=1 Tax=Agromyces indicus TaxID=758919 RepID=A0ABU1FLT9_9MICO|nr:DEAD/DEAH box helicase [Agromyces indicus]MDR5692727.1 DEAD/DEAH box helicase [Agromyces indicus]
MPEPESPASGARGATVAAATDGTDWRARLEGLTGARADAAVAGERPLGLQFELRRRVLRRPGQFQGARDEPARRAASVDRLGVRPVTRGSRGAWIKAGLTWQNIAYQGESGGYDPAQARWFAQFAALKGSPAGGIPTWGSELITVDEYASPLFWALLAEARRLGVHLVGADATPDVRLAAAAWVGLEATVDAEGALALVPTVDVDGAASTVEHARAVGEHGVYRFDFDTGVIELAPVAGGATSAQLALLGGADVLHVPAADLDEFLRAHHRVLARTLPIRSSDGSFAPPPAPPADLVLTATHAPAGSLRLAWAWDHGDGRTSPLAASVDPVRFDGEPVEARAAVIAAAVGVLAGFEADRDETAERVRAVLEHARDDEVELHDADAAAFADRVVPRLEALGRVRVEVVGDPPDFRELTDRPTFTVTTVESRQADWFDLGVLVTVAGRTVPFMPLFRALSTGARRLKLVDNSYLSLRRPEFDELRELLDEAGTLAEWETGMRIHRSRASLWADFEDLADAAEPAVSWRATVAGLADDAAVEPLPEPDGLALPLRPYQLDGFRWLAFLWRHRLGGILADDMGLGKTAQTLALVQHAVEAQGRGAPFLVVAPTSVASNWVREAARFTPGLRAASVAATEGAGRPTIAEVAADADLVITTYAVLRLDADAFAALEWGGLVLDEAQFVKNPATKAHEAARGIRAPFRLAVTGTPVENHLGELWAILNLVAPGLFPSRRAFDERFRRPIEEDGNAERRDLLRRRIRPLMLRRTKEAVAPELPPKQEQVLTVALAPRHRRLYDATLQRERQKLLDLLDDDLDRQRFIVYRSLTLLRMLALDASLIDERHAGMPSAKLDALFEQLDDVLAEGHRALVFSQFTSFLGRVAGRLEAEGVPYAYLDGATPARARDEEVARFRSGAASVFCISLKAGGFGLNLTEADYVFLLDPWWNPASEQQAVDRAHRIGQDRRVMVYRLVAEGTIEEKVMALKARKGELVASVLDGDPGATDAALSAADVRELLDG